MKTQVQLQFSNHFPFFLLTKVIGHNVHGDVSVGLSLGSSSKFEFDDRLEENKPKIRAQSSSFDKNRVFYVSNRLELEQAEKIGPGRAFKILKANLVLFWVRLFLV